MKDVEMNNGESSPLTGSSVLVAALFYLFLLRKRFFNQLYRAQYKTNFYRYPSLITTKVAVPMCD